MKILAFSDIHLRWHTLNGDMKLPKADIGIFCGDIHAVRIEDFVSFLDWFRTQPIKHQVMIAGNHDSFLVGVDPFRSGNFHYLCDSGVEIEGLKIWGSPWSPVFGRWSFMLHGEERKEKWSQIPKDTDILVTHTPPQGTLDTVRAWFERNAKLENCGCEYLTKRVQKVKPKLHLFGHIHERYGFEKKKYTEFYNCSLVNRRNQLVNKPWEIELSENIGQLGEIYAK